ncbi:hypothetical protein [Rubrivivax albus]|uniref:Uncharacterized protein n=1 Tax=Rubrivivax albus TaxID=2499835 RepID=A0A3S2TMC3_9BURK|nr:hypothetical protein [Rubrivivax albus]RVT51663.1 hypothetical protein ENE75_12680 [Rubrivivax albus]
MHEPLNTLELHRLHDEAHARAEALRRAARDDVWRGADALLCNARSRALRAADRLAHRIGRHGRPGGAASATAGCPAASAG